MNGLDHYVGQTLDEKYRLERLLGKGGMGAVYLATHLGTGRYVAVKLITPQFMRNQEFVQRFQREARAAGRLRHPNIVDVTDFGFAQVEGENIAYLVMEYLDGCTLREVIAEEHHLPVQWVVEILEQVCSAVHEAHKQGIIHRDLKPDNIWLEPNRLGGYRAKVLDFGIAKLAETSDVAPGAPARPVVNASPTIRLTPLLEAAGPDAPGGEPAPLTIHPQEVPVSPASEPTIRLDFAQPTPAPAAGGTTTSGQLTRAGAILGTPCFMSPEQCRGEPQDARSDIYSLGVIAYQMLCGSPPFTGEPLSVLRAHCESQPPSLREHNRKLPEGISRVVMSALAKDPAARPQTALSLAHSLRANADGLGVLYRRAFALYSEYFPTIFKVSLLAHIPVMAVMLITIGVRLAESRRGGASNDMVGVALEVFKNLASFVTSSTIAGVTAIIVAQLAVAPLKAVELRPAFAVLLSRWRPFLTTGVLVTLRLLLGLIPLAIPAVLLTLRYALWAPVVLMEGLQNKAALKRTAALTTRSQRDILVAVAFQFFMPKLVEKLIGINTDPKGGTFSKVIAELASLTSVFVSPLVSIVPALLYLKLRQFGGEPLTEVMARLADAGAGRNWERRMRARLAPTPPSQSA